MGLLFSKRVGSDPYYANYEKSFERLEKECTALLERRLKRRKKMESYSSMGFWLFMLTGVVSLLFIAALQHLAHASFLSKFSKIAMALAVPAVVFVGKEGLLRYMRWWETRDERFIKKLHDNKRKMIKELKDSTRFEKTIALIKKYDPDEAQNMHASMMPSPKVKDAANGNLRRRKTDGPKSETSKDVSSGGGAGSAGGQQQQQQQQRVTTPSGLLKPAAYAAGLTMDAGRALFPVFDKLASSVIGDNPVLLEDIRRATAEAGALKNENDTLRGQLDDLRRRLDLLTDCPPPQEEGADQDKHAAALAADAVASS